MSLTGNCICQNPRLVKKKMLGSKVCVNCGKNVRIDDATCDKLADVEILREIRSIKREIRTLTDRVQHLQKRITSQV